MRATSQRRRSEGKRSKAIPALAPVKDRPASASFTMVETVKLHPDHEVCPAKAEALGLVSTAQIARAFGVSSAGVTGWSRQPGFPKRRAWLQVDGYSGRSHLYDRTEVIAWVAKRRPKYLSKRAS